MPKAHKYCSVNFEILVFFSWRRWMLVGEMMKLMTTETSLKNFFREEKKVLQSMQVNLQAKKCKLPIERSKKNTVSMQNEEKQYQELRYNSDD